jgi:hypothetical protein
VLPDPEENCQVASKESRGVRPVFSAEDWTQAQRLVAEKGTRPRTLRQNVNSSDAPLHNAIDDRIITAFGVPPQHPT